MISKYVCLFSLEMLILDGNDFCSLPYTLGQLDHLSLSDCASLVSLPELPPSLTILNASGCTSMEIIPSLSSLKRLESLIFRNCSSLVEVRGMENLIS